MASNELLLATEYLEKEKKSINGTLKKKVYGVILKEFKTKNIKYIKKVKKEDAIFNFLRNK